MDNDSSHRASRLWSTARLLDQSISPAATGPHPSDATFGRLARSTWQPVRCNHYGELTPEKFFGDRPYCRGSESVVLSCSTVVQLSSFGVKGLSARVLFVVIGWRQRGQACSATQHNQTWHTRRYTNFVYRPRCALPRSARMLPRQSLSQSTTHVRLFGQRSRIKA